MIKAQNYLEFVKYRGHLCGILCLLQQSTVYHSVTFKNVNVFVLGNSAPTASPNVSVPHAQLVVY